MSIELEELSIQLNEVNRGLAHQYLISPSSFNLRRGGNYPPPEIESPEMAFLTANDRLNHRRTQTLLAEQKQIRLFMAIYSR